MVEFIDKSTDKPGTPLNRATMLAIQGFIGSNVAYNPDGSITETNSKGETLRTQRNEDGSYTQIFEGEKTIVKTTTFGSNRTITEVIS